MYCKVKNYTCQVYSFRSKTYSLAWNFFTIPFVAILMFYKRFIFIPTINIKNGFYLQISDIVQHSFCQRLQFVLQKPFEVYCDTIHVGKNKRCEIPRFFRTCKISYLRLVEQKMCCLLAASVIVVHRLFVVQFRHSS